MKILRILTTLMMAVLGATVLAYAGLPFVWSIIGLLLFSYITPRQQGVLSVSLYDLAAPSESNSGGGGGISSEIILIPEENIDWDSWVGRDASNILNDIPLKNNKYMHRLYGTQATIKPTQKKVNGSNKDCGGWEVGLELFHPGLTDDSLKWLNDFAFTFKGLVIVQNCSTSSTTKYLLGEPCNLVYIDQTESMWGEEVDKDKGHKIVFKGKQSQPFCLYAGSLTYDPGSTSW